MPTYVYRFVDTGETIEVRQSFDDAALTEAPHPSDGTLRPVKKVFTPVGVTFKGSGFYKTDSGASAKSSSASTTSATDPSTGGTSTGDSSTASKSGDSASSGASTSTAAPASTPSTTST